MAKILPSITAGGQRQRQALAESIGRVTSRTRSAIVPIVPTSLMVQAARDRQPASPSAGDRDVTPGSGTSAGTQQEDQQVTDEEIVDSVILDQSGGTEVGSEETEVIGDDPDEELVKVSTTYLREVPQARISETGFITDLAFVFQIGVAEPEFSSRVQDSVIIQAERYSGEGQAAYDYTSLSSMDPISPIPSTGGFDSATNIIPRYSDAEIDSLRKFIGGGADNEGFFRMTAEETTQKIISLFDFYRTEFNIESSILNNSYTMDKKIKLSAVSEDLPDIGRTDPMADLYESVLTDTTSTSSSRLDDIPVAGSLIREEEEKKQFTPVAATRSGRSSDGRSMGERSSDGRRRRERSDGRSGRGY